MSQPQSPWWAPDRHQDRRAFLAARSAILAGVRGYFQRRGFVEADVDALAIAAGAEVHIDPIAADGRYLHASPEFALKKLLAAGETKIYFLGKVYRGGESGPRHRPEFTLLEFYRAGEGVAAIQRDCLAIARLAQRIAAGFGLAPRGTCDWTKPAERLSLTAAFARHLGADLRSLLAADGTGALAPMQALAAAQGLSPAADDDWSDLFAKLLTQRIEPLLGARAITLLTDYPAPEAALARRLPADPRFAERFEVYIDAIELANGYGELTDPVEQRARLLAARAERQRRYGADLPIDEDFLAALGHMPPAAGVALGIDRLVMLAVGAPDIDAVVWSAPRARP